MREPFTLYTLTSVCLFFILFSIHRLRCFKGEKNNQELTKLAIISFILVTFMCDSGGILKVEIRCYSLSTFLVKDIVAILLRTTLWTSLEEKKKT